MLLLLSLQLITQIMKRFLGYEWSKRKGQEGIKYIGVNISEEEMEVSKNQAINSIQTPLFNPLDLEDNSKINTIIRNNFIKDTVTIPKELENLVSCVQLVDMLDFTQINFDGQIKTTQEKKIEISSKYPIEKLGKVVDVRIGGTPSRSNYAYYQNGNNLWVSISEMNGQTITSTKEMITDEAVKNSNVKLIPKGTTLLSFKLSIGKTAIARLDFSKTSAYS